MKNIAVYLTSIALSLPGAILASDDLIKEIQAQNQLYMDAYRSGNADAIVSIHTQDALVMAPKFPPARGHEEIRAALVGELASGDGELELKSIEVTQMNEKTAYEIGQYKLRIDLADGGILEEQGSTLLIWKLGVDDIWRIHVDMWNSNHPGQ